MGACVSFQYIFFSSGESHRNFLDFGIIRPTSAEFSYRPSGPAIFDSRPRTSRSRDHIIIVSKIKSTQLWKQ